MKKNIVTPDKNHLTEGTIIRSIFLLAFPILVRAVLQSLQSVIDMFWVGKLGSTAIAAVSMGGTVIMVLIPLLFGISTGTVALISRSIGSRYYHKANEIAAQSFIIALISSVFFVILGLSLSKPILQMLHAEGAVLFLGESYLKILLMGGITMALLFIGGAILQGAGDAVTPMNIMVGVTLLNMVLDPVLIFGLLGLPKLGVNGAALATVSAQAAGALIMLFMLTNGRCHIHVPVKKIKIDAEIIWHMLKIGIPSSVQFFLRNFMNMVLISVVAGFGTYAIASYGIGMRLRMFVLMPAFALGEATAALVGQNLGAKKKDRAAECARMATLIDVVLMTLFAFLFFFFSKQIISFFNPNPDIIQAGSQLLKITAPFFPFVALGVVFGRALQGAGETVAPMLITLVTLWGLQIPLAVILAKNFQWETSGVWWAIAVTSVINGLLTLLWFSLGHWKKKKILHHEILGQQ